MLFIVKSVSHSDGIKYGEGLIFFLLSCTRINQPNTVPDIIPKKVTSSNQNDAWQLTSQKRLVLLCPPSLNCRVLVSEGNNQTQLIFGFRNWRHVPSFLWPPDTRLDCFSQSTTIHHMATEFNGYILASLNHHKLKIHYRLELRIAKIDIHIHPV